MESAISISVDPVVGWPAMITVTVLIAALLSVGFLRRARGMLYRVAVAVLIVLATLNPQILRESRESLDNVVLVLVDRSDSQSLGQRPDYRAEAVEHLRARLSEMRGIEMRPRDVANEGDGTRLFSAMRQGLRDIPRDRLAGVIVVGDGRIHDRPGSEILGLDVPIHGIVTGNRDEKDRRLVVESAPEFALVDRPVTLRLRVEDTPDAPLTPPPDITIRQDGRIIENRAVDPGRTITVPLRLERRGASAIEILVNGASEELTERNNSRMLQINGVRDRLRVLLVSGEPHQGERVWRTALKSDPAVDLIHFTILRLPTSQDRTPATELSLIPFPTQELFEEQLDNFDLVIFDRYRLRGVLQPSYFDNLVNYILEGGAILLVNGDEFASLRSLSRTALSSVLPATPTGNLIQSGFTPRLTSVGTLHPITNPFQGQAGTWGRWFRMVQTNLSEGRVLMSGPENAPLLVVSRMGEGRTAQILSDHLWLWARGIEGGGPHQTLVRRLAHWLMKEPDLEEERLTATATSNDEIAVEYRSLEPNPARSVDIVAPDGSTTSLELRPTSAGIAGARFTAPESGTYRVRLGQQTVFVSIGISDPVEMENPLATTEFLAGVSEPGGGGLFWREDGLPRVRMVGPRDRAAGNGWLGLVDRKAHRTIAVEQAPLVPAWLYLLAIGAVLIAAWRREGT